MTCGKAIAIPIQSQLLGVFNREFVVLVHRISQFGLFIVIQLIKSCGNFDPFSSQSVVVRIESHLLMQWDCHPWLILLDLLSLGLRNVLFNNTTR
ncbi:hypothetical protein PsorP6_013335 [Peronosclerospora sorghi]|uniref:Uncharacterized protein n=1 Tax=Peronosclerospora sorghi TaxID=230839 RepID=A0ACC0WJ50_9STRA|nr:hypothetical protein PsorP6_013335 [Peronosclerospora sorghi]